MAVIAVESRVKYSFVEKGMQTRWKIQLKTEFILEPHLSVKPQLTVTKAIVNEFEIESCCSFHHCYLTGICICMVYVSNCKRWCWCNVNIQEKLMLSLNADSCKWNKLSFDSCTFCTFCSSHPGFELHRHSSLWSLALTAQLLGKSLETLPKRVAILLITWCFRNENCFVDTSSDHQCCWCNSVVDSSFDHQ